jgi:hypothetical protein
MGLLVEGQTSSNRVVRRLVICDIPGGFNGRR